MEYEKHVEHQNTVLMLVDVSCLLHRGVVQIYWTAVVLRQVATRRPGLFPDLFVGSFQITSDPKCQS